MSGAPRGLLWGVFIYGELYAVGGLEIEREKQRRLGHRTPKPPPPRRTVKRKLKHDLSLKEERKAYRKNYGSHGERQFK